MQIQDIPTPMRIRNTLWKKGDIIRHTESAKPYLVLHIFIDSCTLIADLEADTSPAQPLILLMRDYDRYCLDHDMIRIPNEEDFKWEFQEIQI